MWVKTPAVFCILLCRAVRSPKVFHTHCMISMGDFDSNSRLTFSRSSRGSSGTQVSLIVQYGLPPSLPEPLSSFHTDSKGLVNQDGLGLPRPFVPPGLPPGGLKSGAPFITLPRGTLLFSL